MEAIHFGGSTKLLLTLACLNLSLSGKYFFWSKRLVPRLGLGRLTDVYPDARGYECRAVWASPGFCVWYWCCYWHKHSMALGLCWLRTGIMDKGRMSCWRKLVNAWCIKVLGELQEQIT